MSVIIKLAEDRFVELDVRSMEAEEVEASDSPVVDESPEPESSGSDGESGGGGLRRFVALGGFALGVLWAARKLRGDDADPIEEVAVETEVAGADESDAEADETEIEE